MKKLKRALSFLLTAAITLTAVSVPTAAEYETVEDPAELVSEEIFEAEHTNDETENAEESSDEEAVEEVVSNGDTVDSGTCGENLTWTLDDEGTLTISGTGEMDDYKWDSPWSSKNKIKKAVIENGVTSIGDFAFYGCNSLSSIDIPESVTSIGDYVFSFCFDLKSIDLPESVMTIGNIAFYYCTALTNIAIPDSVTSIGEGAFSDCSALTSINIPNGVTSIGEGAFGNCRALTSIDIPNGVTSIGKSAFSGCSALTSINIPNGVTSIGGFAFYRCSSLTSITIPDSVTDIGNYAFTYCSSLTSITIPESVTSIGFGVFGKCSSLVSIAVSENNINYCDVNDILFNKNKTSLISYPCKKTDTSYIIPDGVESIMTDAFSGCTTLTSITIPEGVTSIGESAFEDCTSLTSIDIPDSVTTIGYSTFRGCSSLTSIDIPDKVSSIENSTFCGCSSLTNVTIPDSVTYIGSWAFDGCSSLTSITIPDSVTTINNDAFSGCSSLISITIPDNVTFIGGKAFYDCSSLISINVSENNNRYCSIDGVLFEKYKTSLERLVCYPAGKKDKTYSIPEGILIIESYAFQGCSSLTSVTIPEGVRTIYGSAFHDCMYLTSINIPNSVTAVYGYSFYNCSSLISINVSENNNSYCSIDGVLYSKYNTSLKELEYYPIGKKDKSYVLPDGITSIRDWAFRGCSSLTSITIPESVTYIGDSAFYGCSSLTSIAIPESVTSIESMAFLGCKSLTSVTIPEGVTSIGSSAFRRCSSLGSIIVPKSVTYINSYAFFECSSLADIYYTGTEEQWNAIENYGDIPVNCTIHFNCKPYIVLSATPGDKSVILNWSEVPGATKYGVYFYNESTNKYTKINLNVTDTTYTVTGLAENTEYSFFVQAYKNKWLAGSDESYATAKTAVMYPIVKAEGGDKSVTLTWQEIPGAVKYGVYKVTNGKYTKLSTNGAETEYTVTGLANDTEYTFFVQAYTTKWLPGGEGSTVTVKTLTTYPIVEAEGGDKSVTLSWQEIPGAVKYGVYKFANNKYTKLDLNVTKTTYTVNGLADDTEYTFFVQAYTTKWLAGGDKSYATARTNAALTYPVVTATPSVNSVKLTWTEVSDATKYGVYRYDPSTNKYTKININVTKTEYTVTGLAPNTQYSFFVQAYTTKWLAGGDGSTVTVTTA